MIGIAANAYRVLHFPNRSRPIVAIGRNIHSNRNYRLVSKRLDQRICLDVNGENMIYKVKARVIEETIGEFYRKLADGTVFEQRPDGEEIVASMKRAVLTELGVAEWYQMCFCPTPLDHERRTQYDLYFTDMTTEPAEARGEIQGASLWSYMASKAETLGRVE
jgi:hypothetical protein